MSVEVVFCTELGVASQIGQCPATTGDRNADAARLLLAVNDIVAIPLSGTVQHKLARARRQETAGIGGTLRNRHRRPRVGGMMTERLSRAPPAILSPHRLPPGPASPGRAADRGQGGFGPRVTCQSSLHRDKPVRGGRAEGPCDVPTESGRENPPFQGAGLRSAEQKIFPWPRKQPPKPPRRE